MMKSSHKISIALLSVLLAFSSCEEDETDSPEMTTAVMRTLTLEVEPMWGDESLTLNTDYLVGGKMVNLDFFAMYLSEMEIANNDGQVIASEDVVLVPDSLSSFELGVLTAEFANLSELGELTLSVGLDSLVNHSDPITAPAPLNDVVMHWNWNPAAGYKFVRMDGTLDGQEFASHAAGDALYREGITVDLSQVDAQAENIIITLQVDMQAAFEGVIFSDGNNHGPSPVANQMYMNNLGTGEPFSAR